MKIFLVGDYKKNAGPCNVNKSLIYNSDKDMIYIKNESRLLKLLEIIYKGYSSDIIVVSGLFSNKIINLLKIFHKPLVYIMHGYAKYENEINNLNADESLLNAEQKIFEYSDRILCVSENYSEWVKEKLPEFSYKISFLNNGVNIEVRAKKDKIKNSIAVSGGNRSIKNNVYVCEAIKKLNEENFDCSLNVFGKIKNNNDNFEAYPFVKLMGQMDKEEYYDELDKISLFVLNSDIESFGLVVADAINCNCSLLVSSKVGAISILNLTEDEIIYDNHDIDDIAEKIKALLENSNSERLYKSLDIQSCSEMQAYINLKNICKNVLDFNRSFKQ